MNWYWTYKLIWENELLGNLVRFPLHACCRSTYTHASTYTGIGHLIWKRPCGKSGQIPSPCGRHTHQHASTTHLYIHKHWTRNSGKMIFWAIWSESLSMRQANPQTHTQICMQALSMQIWDLNLSLGQSGQIPSPCGKQIKHMLTHLHIIMKHAPLGNLSSGAIWWDVTHKSACFTRGFIKSYREVNCPHPTNLCIHYGQRVLVFFGHPSNDEANQCIQKPLIYI